MSIFSKMKAQLSALLSATGTVAEPQVPEFEECTHPAWTEESSTNNWRSNCKVCGLQAQGSCQ